MYTKVKFTEGFKDGNIFPDRSFAPGEEAVLSDNELARVSSSGGVFQVVEQMIPNPLKAEKQLERSEMNDPQNAENSINDLETHVPGLEEEQEAVREKEQARKKKK